MKATTRNMYLLVLLVGVLVLMYIRYLRPYGTEGFESAPTFTMYYADWCPHCKTIKPIFAEWSASKSVTVSGKTVFVDMVEVDSKPEKVKGKPVKGYPTFLLETADGKFKEFDGERTAKGWEGWLSKNV